MAMTASMDGVLGFFRSFRERKARRVILGNFLSLTFLQYASYIFPLLTVPYLTRVIGVERFGLVAFSQAFVSYFAVLVNYGFSFTATRQVAIERENKDRLREIFSQVIWAKMMLAALGFLLMIGFALLLPQYRAEFRVFLASYTVVVGGVISSEWFFQGIEEMKYTTIAGLTARGITTVLLFLLVKSRADFLYVPVLYGLGIFCGGGFGQYIIWRKLRIVIGRPDLPGIWKQLREGWDTFLSCAFVSLYTTSNAFFLGLMTNTTQVGYYAAGEKVVTGLRSLWGPVPQVLYPHFSKVFSHDVAKGKRQLRKVLGIAGAVTLLLSLVGCLAAPFIVRVYLGANFQHSTRIIQVLVFTIFAIGISNILGVQGLLANGMNAVFRNIVLFSAVQNIVLLFIFVRVYGAIGTAISVLIVECTIVLVQWVVLRRRKLI
jgi:PST family polysaccharide transporter